MTITPTQLCARIRSHARSLSGPDAELVENACNALLYAARVFEQRHHTPALLPLPDDSEVALTALAPTLVGSALRAANLLLSVSEEKTT